MSGAASGTEFATLQGMKPKLRLFVLALAGMLAACDRDSSAVQRQGANEGKAAQSAAGGSANEGKAVGSAGR
jgi:hypothetical protein